MITLVHIKTGNGLNSKDYVAINKIPSGLPEDVEFKAQCHWLEGENEERRALGGGTTFAMPGCLMFVDYLELNPLRVEWFLDAYRRQYNAARDANPQEYSGERDQVLARMYSAILKGKFNKDSESFKRTCKQLNIKHTYKAIESYLKGE